jgi:hypothetical protein
MGKRKLYVVLIVRSYRMTIPLDDILLRFISKIIDYTDVLE